MYGAPFTTCGRLDCARGQFCEEHGPTPAPDGSPSGFSELFAGSAVMTAMGRSAGLSVEPQEEESDQYEDDETF